MNTSLKKTPNGNFRVYLQNKKKLFEKKKIIFKETIERIVKNTDIPIFQGCNLTDAQKKALIFNLLFTGPETTSALLIFICWKLALDQKKQEELYQAIKNGEDKVIHELFRQRILAFPPAYGVGPFSARYSDLN